MGQITKEEFEYWKTILHQYLHWKRKVIRGKLYDNAKFLVEDLKKMPFLCNNKILNNFKSPYFQFKLENKRGVMLDIGGEGWEQVGDKIIKYCLNPLIKNNDDKKHVCGIGEYLPFENNFFDFVVVKDALEFTIRPELVFKEINRVLKDNGKFYLTMCTSLDGYWNKTGFTYEIISSWLNKYFNSETEFFDFCHRFSYCGIKKHCGNLKKETMPKFISDFIYNEIPLLKKTFMDVNFQQ
jgi:SAM-dependent methyltransferase